MCGKALCTGGAVKEWRHLTVSLPFFVMSVIDTPKNKHLTFIKMLCILKRKHVVCV
jgi:hypothetical protein